MRQPQPVQGGHPETESGQGEHGVRPPAGQFFDANQQHPRHGRHPCQRPPIDRRQRRPEQDRTEKAHCPRGTSYNDTHESLRLAGGIRSVTGLNHDVTRDYCDGPLCARIRCLGSVGPQSREFPIGASFVPPGMIGGCWWSGGPRGGPHTNQLKAKKSLTLPQTGLRREH